MKAAAILSFLVALILGGTSFSGWYDDQRDRPAYLRELSHDFDRRNSAAMDQYIAEARGKEHTQALEAIGGAVFLIAGLALWSKRPQPSPH